MSKHQAPRALVLYHYMYPDGVVSARHFDDLCVGLVERGWCIEAMPCNRGCRDESLTYRRREQWQGISFRRVWRPRFRQASPAGRLLNAGWMAAAWATVALRRPSRLPDVVILGTDPAFSFAAALPIKRLRPGVTVAHWCFDLFPEATVGAGLLSQDSRIVKILSRLTGAAYRACDLVADIGPCMRERLDAYGHGRRSATLIPWALSEPEKIVKPDPATRKALFGDAALAILYSGNFGRAHTYAEMIELARKLRGGSIHFSFGVRGNQAQKVRDAVANEPNISLAPFAPESELELRLGAADVHLASLKEGYTGVSIPSKFWGSLAAGRPVVFAGSPRSGPGQWIREHGLGWILDEHTVEAVATELKEVARSPAKLADMGHRCRQVYFKQFARDVVIDQWDSELRSLLGMQRIDPAAPPKARWQTGTSEEAEPASTVSRS